MDLKEYTGHRSAQFDFLLELSEGADSGKPVKRFKEEQKLHEESLRSPPKRVATPPKT